MSHLTISQVAAVNGPSTPSALSDKEPGRKNGVHHIENQEKTLSRGFDVLFSRRTKNAFQIKYYRSVSNVEKVLNQISKQSDVTDVICYFYLINRYIEFQGTADKVIEFCKKALFGITVHDIANRRIAFFYEKLLHSLNQLELYDECVKWREKLSLLNPNKAIPLAICYEIAIAYEKTDLSNFKKWVEYVNSIYPLSNLNEKSDQHVFRISCFLNGLALISSEKIEEGLTYLEKGFANHVTMKSDLYLRYSEHLAFCYFQKGNYQEVEEICRNGLEHLKSCQKTAIVRFFIARLTCLMIYAMAKLPTNELLEIEFKEIAVLMPQIQFLAELYYFYALTTFQLGEKGAALTWIGKSQARIPEHNEDLKRKLDALSLQLQDYSQDI